MNNYKLYANLIRKPDASDFNARPCEVENGPRSANGTLSRSSRIPSDICKCKCSMYFYSPTGGQKNWIANSKQLHIPN